MAEFQITANGIKSLNDYTASPSGGPTADLSWAQTFLVDNTFDPLVFKDIESTEEQYQYLQDRSLWGYDLNNPSLIMSRTPGTGTDPSNPPSPLSDAARRGLNLDNVTNNYEKAVHLKGNPIRRGIKDVKYDYTIPQAYGTYLFNIIVIFNSFGFANPESDEQMPIFSFYYIGESAKKIGGEGTIVINAITRYENGDFIGPIVWDVNTTEAAQYLTLSSVEALPRVGDPEITSGNNVYRIDSGNGVNPDSPVPYGRDSEGNPFTAVWKGDDIDGLWTFSNFSVDITFGGLPIVASTNNSIIYDDSSLALTDVETEEMGNFIIEFLDGGSKGVCRTVSGIDESTKTISWLVDIAGGIASDTTLFALYESTSRYIRRSSQINPGPLGSVLTMVSPTSYAFAPNTYGREALQSERPWPELNLDNFDGSANLILSNRYNVTAAQANPYFNVPGYLDHVNISNQHIRQTFIATGHSDLYPSSSFIATREWSDTNGLSDWEYFYPTNLVDTHPIVQEIRKSQIAFPRAQAVTDRINVQSLGVNSLRYSSVLGVDGKIYSVAATTIMVIDPLTRTYEFLPYTGYGSWYSLVNGPDGKIYGVPYSATTILIIDPITGTISDSSMGATIPSNVDKWMGGILGDDGKIYCIPHSSTNILIIDPIAGTATTSDMGADLTGGNKWRGCAKGVDGKIYGIPFNANDFLVIDTENGIATRTNFGTTLAGVGKFAGAVLGGDGNIYCIPFSSTNIGILDVVKGTLVLSNMGADLTGGNKWRGGTIGSDGKIYAVPASSNDFLVIDPILGSAERTTLGASIGVNDSFSYPVLAQDGCIYATPGDTDTTYVIIIENKFSTPVSNALIYSTHVSKF